MKNLEEKDFTAYEYISIKVISDKEELYKDCYENFGWILIKGSNNALVDKDDYYLNNYGINKWRVLKFKRDRSIRNKAKVNDLQLKCEIELKKIDKLEKESTIKGTIIAVILAILGIIFVILSVIFLKYSLALEVTFGIIGLLFWIISYPVYKSIKNKYDLKNYTLIEQKYNEIYDYCEEAITLING